MDSATWCRTPAAASAARRLRPEVSKNSSTALSSNEGELARSITTCAPAMASLRPSPVMLLTPVFGEAATTSWPRWRRMGTVLEPIRPVPPITTIFIPNLLVRSPQAGPRGFTSSCETLPFPLPQKHSWRSTFRFHIEDEQFRGLRLTGIATHAVVIGGRLYKIGHGM